MIDLTTIVKDCVSSVCKSAEFIQIMVLNNILLINVADTSLSLIDLGFDTKGYFTCDYTSGMELPPLFLDHDFKLDDKMNKYLTWINTEVPNYEEVARCDDLRTIPEYEELVSRKAADGAAFFKLAGNKLYESFLIPVFSGFPVLNKQDKIGVIVKRIDRETLLIYYNIYKKKINRNISLLFRTIDMDRSLLSEMLR